MKSVAVFFIIFICITSASSKRLLTVATLYEKSFEGKSLQFDCDHTSFTVNENEIMCRNYYAAFGNVKMYTQYI